MARVEKPDKLDKVIDLAIAIDQRMYERAMEHQGTIFSTLGYRGSLLIKWNDNCPKQPYYRPMPMEIDMA